MHDRRVTFMSSSRSRLSLAAIVTLLPFLSPLAAQPSAQAALRPDHAETLIAEVSVQSLSAGRVAVILDQFDAPESDATAERVFILESAEMLETELPIYMGVAQVVFQNDRLFIMSLAEPRAVGVFLSKIGANEVENRLAANLARRYGHSTVGAISLLSGYGLSDYRGGFLLPIETWPPQERPENSLQPKIWDNVITEKSGCISGGPGSSSCSVDCPFDVGCSVSCVTGYYACCECKWTVPGCSCIPDGSCGPRPCEP